MTGDAGRDADLPAEQYIWMVEHALFLGFRRQGFEFEPGEYEPAQVQRGLQRAIDSLGEQNRITVEIESPTCVAVIVEGGHEDPFMLDRRTRPGRYEAAINEFLHSEEHLQSTLIDPVKASPHDAVVLVDEALEAMDVSDMVVADVFQDKVRLRRRGVDRQAIADPHTAASTEEPERMSVPDAGSDAGDERRTAVLRGFIGYGMDEWELDNAPGKVAGLQRDLYDLNWEDRIAILATDDKVTLRLLRRDEVLQQRYAPLYQCMKMLDQIAQGGKEREHINLGSVTDEEWHRIADNLEVICRETNWCRDWRISRSSNAYGRGILVERTSWAKRTLDDMLEEFDKNIETSAVITFTVGDDRPDYLGGRLRDEVKARGFRNVIAVDWDDREFTLDYHAPNMDVLMADDLDDLAKETKLVGDFVSSSERRRVIPAGTTSLESRRKMGFVAAAAMDAGVLDLVHLAARPGEVVLSREH